ncbi:hypothetical protein [Ottowia testudinis]|uniref:Uncharacterized protein n=1 Tax=Ottowia testudinis TaxID=2816950 RepID=A0A975CHL4_9BURK|nr:hypothetical protein [Ottowia testudinis]QTD45236.1 hypothetical protein J1M35_19835 [Ottowia testudinis]
MARDRLTAARSKSKRGTINEPRIRGTASILPDICRIAPQQMTRAAFDPENPSTFSIKYLNHSE